MILKIQPFPFTLGSINDNFPWQHIMNDQANIFTLFKFLKVAFVAKAKVDENNRVVVACCKLC